MGYFPNMTAWECWATDNCFRCAHWPKDDEAPMCPVETAHTLFNYDLCNDTESPGAQMLEMLIPTKKGGHGNEKCAMFMARNGVTDKHLKDWAKYKEIMAEMAPSKEAMEKIDRMEQANIAGYLAARDMPLGNGGGE